MSKDKGTGGYEEIFEFTPVGGFDIRNASRKFSQMMIDSLRPLVIHLPHASVEFEPGCTPQEIVDGYHSALKLGRAAFVYEGANDQ